VRRENKNKNKKKRKSTAGHKNTFKGSEWTLIAPGVQLEEGLFWVACTWPRPAFY
jgi:hypothetical protein